jgi:hypothetical protein
LKLKSTTWTGPSLTLVKEKTDGATTPILNETKKRLLHVSLLYFEAKKEYYGLGYVMLRKKEKKDRASTPTPLKLKKEYYRLGYVRLREK